MNTALVDRVLMVLAAMMIAVFAILGMTRVLDLDDARLRYPEPEYSPKPVYVHPEEVKP